MDEVAVREIICLSQAQVRPQPQVPSGTTFIDRPRLLQKRPGKKPQVAGARYMFRKGKDRPSGSTLRVPCNIRCLLETKGNQRI